MHRFLARTIQVAAMIIGAAAVTTAGLAYTPGSTALDQRSELPAYPATAKLAAISCQGSTWCMAVGSYIDRAHSYHSLAQIWSKGAWHVLNPPPGLGLSSVSCTSAWFCVASGPAGTQSWDGQLWTAMASPPSALGPPTCGDRQLCLAISRGDDTTDRVIETWTGGRWQTWPGTGVCRGSGAGCGLAAISCGNGINCVAVGSTAAARAGDREPAGKFWNGTGFVATEPPGAGDGGPASDNEISCAGSFCLAVGAGFAQTAGGSVATAASWTTSTGWRDISSTLKLPTLCPGRCFWTEDLSCGSPVNCMTFSSFGHLWWDGTRWQNVPSRSAGRGSALSAVGCGGRICLAVGYQTIDGVVSPLSELWNGTTWKILGMPPMPR